MTSQHEAHERLRRIRHELDAAYYALKRADAKWDMESGTLSASHRGKVTQNEIRRATGNLERTYLLRLFADFEGILLEYWQNGMGRTSTPIVSVLMNRIGDRVSVSPDHRDAAHDVRKYRNSLVHPHSDAAQPMTISECVRRLGRYLAYLPQNW